MFVSLEIWLFVESNLSDVFNRHTILMVMIYFLLFTNRVLYWQDDAFVVYYGLGLESSFPFQHR